VFEDIAGNLDVYGAALGWTMLTALTGLVLGVTLGAALATLCWVSRVATGMLTSTVLIVRSVPIVMLIPVLSRLLGYDHRTTIAIVTLISFFPAFVLTSSGLSTLPASADALASVLGASKLRRLAHVALPSAIPNVFGAIRLSAGSAVLAAMVTEFLTGAKGLGRIFLFSKTDMSTERGWGAALVGAAAAIVCFRLSSRLERHFVERMT
jgi:NitT/TauT family transport system permease protein